MHGREAKFFGHTLTGTCVVGIFNVSKRYRFRSVLYANPVCIWKVYTNRRRRRGITSFTSYGNNLVANADNAFLFVLIHDRAIVLKPLNVICDHGHARAGIEVFHLNYGLVRTSVAHRIVVYFHKTVDVIYIAAGGTYPRNVVIVPFGEIATFVVFDQQTKCLSLVLVFCYCLCLREVAHDFFNAACIASTGAEHFLVDLTVFIAREAAV